MSAIPSNLYTSPKVNGLKSIKTTSITLRPVNASSTSEFSYDGNREICFHVPAYQNSYISPKQTFLSMIVNAVRPEGNTTSTYRFNPGYPVFNRIRIKTSSGAIICDIDDYHILQKLLSNFDPEFESKAGITGDYRFNEDEGVDESELTDKGVTIQHDILAGLFSQDLPVGLFSGAAGHSFEITLTLNDPKMCMSSTTGSAPIEDLKYKLSNCNMQIEVVQLPASVNDKLNSQLMSGEKVSIPMVNYRSHKSFIPAASQAVDITLSESALDLESVMTVLLPNGIANNRPDGQIYGDEENTRFYGGKTQGAVKDWQFNYADRFYPSQKIELKTRDQRLALMHAVKNLDLTGKPCIVNQVNQWQHMFAIVQSFKTSKEDDFLNGLNSSSSGALLILQLSLKAAATVPYRVVSFVKQNQTLNVFKGGSTSLTDGSVENF
jgi:hypothetical protein